MQNYLTKEITNDIHPKLIEEGQIANALFITPVINDEQCTINNLRKHGKKQPLLHKEN